MSDRDLIDDVMDRMRSGGITASEAQRDLERSRLNGRITSARRYRAALSEVYGRMPIWFEGPDRIEASGRAADDNS